MQPLTSNPTEQAHVREGRSSALDQYTGERLAKRVCGRVSADCLRLLLLGALAHSFARLQHALSDFRCRMWCVSTPTRPAEIGGSTYIVSLLHWV